MIKRSFVFYVVCLFLFSCSKNRIIVQVGEKIDIKNVKITLKAYDFESSISDHIIFKDGVSEEIPNIYGENDWNIYYGDSLILKFRHFKTNGRNKHDYNFYLKFENDKLKCRVDIQGENEEEIEN